MNQEQVECSSISNRLDRDAIRSDRLRCVSGGTIRTGAGSIKGDVKRKYFSLSAGRGSCPTSSPLYAVPCAVLARSPRHPLSRDPGPSAVHSSCRGGAPASQRGGDVPTMVLSETRGLWLCWVVRGGIRWPVRLVA